MAIPGITMVDIDEELAAIHRGECGLCRLGATHAINNKCRSTVSFSRLKECKHGHVYNPLWFKDCPECRTEKDDDPFLRRY